MRASVRPEAQKPDSKSWPDKDFDRPQVCVDNPHSAFTQTLSLSIRIVQRKNLPVTFIFATAARPSVLLSYSMKAFSVTGSRMYFSTTKPLSEPCFNSLSKRLPISSTLPGQVVARNDQNDALTST